MRIPILLEAVQAIKREVQRDCVDLGWFMALASDALGTTVTTTTYAKDDTIIYRVEDHVVRFILGELLSSGYALGKDHQCDRNRTFIGWRGGFDEQIERALELKGMYDEDQEDARVLGMGGVEIGTIQLIRRFHRYSWAITLIDRVACWEGE